MIVAGGQPPEQNPAYSPARGKPGLFQLARFIASRTPFSVDQRPGLLYRRLLATASNGDTMRRVMVAMILAASCSGGSGCSTLIARSGKDVSVLTTREEVQREYGEPSASGLDEKGRPYEDFVTHRKVAEIEEAKSMSMACAMTSGLSEFFAFPTEACHALYGIVVGQDLRFFYDNSGNVEDCNLNGQPGFNLRHPYHSSSESTGSFDLGRPGTENDAEPRR
jgi:hypothetical protein